MIKLSLLVAIAAVAAMARASAPGIPPQLLTDKAWRILQQGFESKRVSKRVNAAHSLRLVHDSPRAEEMLQHALDDPSPKVRAAAARALGPLGARSCVSKLKALLNDSDALVVIAAAHSLLLLGERDAGYEVDYEVLTGERKSANGFVRSQMDQLHDPKVVAMMGVETGIGFLPFGSEGYEFFKRISEDDRTAVRVAAAKELANDPDPKIDAALTRACSDKKAAVRAAAVFAFAKRDNPALLSAIAPALEDKNEMVRDEAAAAVLRLSNAQSQK